MTIIVLTKWFIGIFTDVRINSCIQLYFGVYLYMTICNNIEKLIKQRESLCFHPHDRGIAGSGNEIGDAILDSVTLS